MLLNSAVLSLRFKDEAFIGMSVFSNLSSLRMVVFDNSVKIYRGAFFGCESLAQIRGDKIEIDYSTYSQLWRRGVSFFYGNIIFPRDQEGGIRI